MHGCLGTTRYGAGRCVIDKVEQRECLRFCSLITYAVVAAHGTMVWSRGVFGSRGVLVDTVILLHKTTGFLTKSETILTNLAYEKLHNIGLGF